MVSDKHYPRGGHGGSAEIVGNSGIAVGGNGGRGGAPGCGQGGNGGSAHCSDDTNCITAYVRGGDGGDAGRPARPSLGGVSPLCYMDLPLLHLPGMTDIYGIPQPGKGGDSHLAYIEHQGRRYCFNIILQLLTGPVPKIVDNLEIIDAIDALGHERDITTSQGWWDLAVEKYPEETEKVMAHVRACEGS